MNLKDFLNESLAPTKKIFVVIKPGFLDKSHDIISIYEKAGWKLVTTTVKQLLLSEAEKLYNIHKKEDFYKDLCNYMSSSATRAMIFSKATTDDEFKEATKLKDSIREKYGESDMRNVVHSSDSLEHMKEESSVYFNPIVIK
jgi:nucleoside diphosphate kinase